MAGLLNVVPDTTACSADSTRWGTTGRIGLTGKVIGGNVELFATNSTLGDQAAPDTVIGGVALAPAAEPSSRALMIPGSGGIGAMARRSNTSARNQAVAAVRRWPAARNKRRPESDFRLLRFAL